MDGVLLFNERQLYTALAVISAAQSQMPISAGATISFFLTSRTEASSMSSTVSLMILNIHDLVHVSKCTQCYTHVTQNGTTDPQKHPQCDIQLLVSEILERIQKMHLQTDGTNLYLSTWPSRCPAQLLVQTLTENSSVSATYHTFL